MNKRKKTQLLMMTGGLLLLLLLWGGGVLLNQRSARRAAQAEEEAVPRLATMEAVDSLTLRRGTDSLTFLKGEEGWRWQEDESFPLNEETCTMLAELGADFTAQQSREMADTLTAYGLDAPEKSVTFAAGGESVTVYVGGESSDGTWYARTDRSELLYLIDHQLPDALDVELMEMALPADYPLLSADIIQSIRIQGKDPMTLQVRAVEVAEDGAESASSAETETEYHFFNGEKDVTEDETVIALRTELDTLTLDHMVAWKEADLSPWGLDAPTAAVSVDYLLEGEARAVTLTIGAAAPEGGHYCTVSTRPEAVYLVEDVDALARLG